MKVVVGATEVELLPGEFIFGRNAAAEELFTTPRKIRTAMKFLKSTNRLTTKTTNKFSVVSITNWSTYQNLKDKSDQQSDQQIDQQVTSKRPASDHKQEVKEHKKIKKKEDTNLAPTGEIPVEAEPIYQGSFITVTDKIHTSLTKVYDPKLCLYEYPKADLWMTNNPLKRRKRIGQFLANWMENAANRNGGRQTSFITQPEDNPFLKIIERQESERRARMQR